MNEQPIFPQGALGTALEEAYKEVLRAKTIHGPTPFHSTHEGYAVLLEEVRELESETFFGKKICRNAFAQDLDPQYRKSATESCHKARLREEVIQVAAMALRFASELT
jgi:hypothetical protein